MSTDDDHLKDYTQLTLIDYKYDKKNSITIKFEIYIEKIEFNSPTPTSNYG